MSQSQFGSVTGWIQDLQIRDSEAQRKIWNRFVNRLVRIANRKLLGTGCRVADGDDITNMAFANFFQKTPDQFSELVNREDLWKILTMLVERRAIDQIRTELSQKNGQGRVINEAGLVTPQEEDRPRNLDHFPGEIIPPDLGVMLAEETEARLDGLNCEVLRQIAIYRLEGFPNKEIAEKMQMSIRSVERKLSQIREILVETRL